MPVVRELVNLFTFKQDKSSLASSEKAFSALAKTAAGIGASLVAGVTAATVKMVPALEKSIAEIKFFGGEVQDISDLLDQRKEGGLFSVAEILEVKAGLSSLNVESEQVKESLGFLQDITVARGFNTSLKESSQLLQDIIKSGDPSAIRDLGGISKELAEVLSRTSFSEAFQKGTQKRKLELILGIFRDNKERIEKLAQEQTGTLTQELERSGAVFSDLSLKAGNSFKGALKESLGLVNDIIEALMSAQGLWDTLDSIAGFFQSSAKWLRGNSDGEPEEVVRNIKSNSSKEEESSFFQPSKETISTFQAGKKSFGDLNEAPSSFMSMFRDAWRSSADSVQKTTSEMKISPVAVQISGEIKVKNENGSSADMDSSSVKKSVEQFMTNQIQRALIEKGGIPSTVVPAN